MSDVCVENAAIWERVDGELVIVVCRNYTYRCHDWERVMAELGLRCFRC
jgi:hypothetical protein